ncbi:hypothetical protein IPM62_02440 [Candidatus Woesebacteria bacterium]|nr:MAG: hypothetical protein IPM62_02440 [Candidatus Woesebacteria bacterium]
MTEDVNNPAEPYLIRHKVEEQRSGVRIIRQASEKDLIMFSHLMGNKSLDFARDNLRPESILYYSFKGADKHLAIVKDGKVLQIHLCTKNEQGNKNIFTKKHNQGSNSPHQFKSIEMSFCSIESFDRIKIGRFEEGDKIFKEVSDTLQPGTISFLRFASKFLTLIDPDTQVFLQPTTKQRYRIYQKFVDNNNLRNVRLYYPEDSEE